MTGPGLTPQRAAVGVVVAADVWRSSGDTADGHARAKAELINAVDAYRKAVEDGYDWDWEAYRRTCDPGRQLDGLGDLALFLGGSENSFTGELLKLIGKARATPERFEPLAQAFPREVIAWVTWDRQSSTATPTAEQLCELLTAQQLRPIAPAAAPLLVQVGASLVAGLPAGVDPSAVVALPDGFPGATLHQVRPGKPWPGWRVAHLHSVQPDTPPDVRDVFKGWARANNLYPERTLAGMKIDRGAKTITCRVRAEPGEPGARQESPYSVCQREATLPLLVDPPDVLFDDSRVGWVEPPAGWLDALQRADGDGR